MAITTTLLAFALLTSIFAMVAIGNEIINALLGRPNGFKYPFILSGIAIAFWIAIFIILH